MEKHNKSSYTKSCHSQEPVPQGFCAGKMTALLTTQGCSPLPSRCLACTALSSPSRVEGVPPLGGVGGLSKSISFLGKGPAESRMRGNLSAFTLIELLIVVLIIGILAAVAVPQYQKAVIKSRLATIKPIISAIKNAEEVYYLSNGTYATDLSSLDLSVNCKTVAGANVLACGDSFAIDVIIGYTVTPATSNIKTYYCPNKALTNMTSCLTSPEFVFTVWLDHSNKPGKRECTSNTTIGSKICQTME